VGGRPFPMRGLFGHLRRVRWGPVSRKVRDGRSTRTDDCGGQWQRNRAFHTADRSCAVARLQCWTGLPPLPRPVDAIARADDFRSRTRIPRAVVGRMSARPGPHSAIAKGTGARIPRTVGRRHELAVGGYSGHQQRVGLKGRPQPHTAIATAYGPQGGVIGRRGRLTPTCFRQISSTSLRIDPGASGVPGSLGQSGGR